MSQNSMKCPPQQPLPMLMVSAPAVSFVSAERVLYLARQLRLADGTPLLAVAEMPVGSLADVLVQGMDIAGLQVTLERASGQVLLTMPRQEEALAQVLTPPQKKPPCRRCKPQGLLAFFISALSRASSRRPPC